MIGQTVAEIWWVFYFQRWRQPSFWIFNFFEILTVGTVSIVELRHRATFRRNRSNCGRDLAIFRFFKMAADAFLDFRNMEILEAGRVKTAKMRYCAKFRGDRWNHCFAEIWRFFDFQNMAPPPSCTFKLLKFQRSERSRRSNCVALPNFVEIGKSRPIYGDFSIFQDRGRRHLGFLKLQIFNGQDAQKGQTASSCQISSK